MTSALHAPYLADRACHLRAPLIENVPLARSTYRARLACPELARRIVPGQFLMLRLADSGDPILGRPLALYDTVPGDQLPGGAGADPQGVDVVYLVQGKLTSRLARMQPGQEIEVWGPLGNGFDPRPTAHLVMVAGGIGQTPFLALGREQRGLRCYGDPPRQVAAAARVTLCYGARTKEYLAGVEDFERLGIEVLVSTDDGTAGHHGLVTDVLAGLLDRSPAAHVVCCGPEPMMEAVAHLTAARGVGCQVSLETPMACGIGICFTCVAKVRDSHGAWDYRRTCVEGPVFDAAAIAW